MIVSACLRAHRTSCVQHVAVLLSFGLSVVVHRRVSTDLRILIYRMVKIGALFALNVIAML
jgi:hypothetical protein